MKPGALAVKPKRAIVAFEHPTQDQIQYAAEQIAELGYTPAQPGEQWAGHGDIVEIVAAQYRISRENAAQVVDASVAELWAESPDNPGRVARRLLVRHLTGLRNQVARLISPPPAVEYTYVPKRGADGKIVTDKNGMREYVERPKKKLAQKHSPAFARLVMDIDKLLSVLMGVEDDTDAHSLTRELLEKMEDAASGKTTGMSRQKMSVVQIVKSMTMKQVQQQAIPRVEAKPVEATVVESAVPKDQRVKE